jgi:hypothetical protein
MVAIESPDALVGGIVAARHFSGCLFRFFFLLVAWELMASDVRK